MSTISFNPHSPRKIGLEWWPEIDSTFPLDSNSKALAVSALANGTPTRYIDVVAQPDPAYSPSANFYDYDVDKNIVAELLTAPTSGLPMAQNVAFVDCQPTATAADGTASLPTYTGASLAASLQKGDVNYATFGWSNGFLVAFDTSVVPAGKRILKASIMVLAESTAAVLLGGRVRKAGGGFIYDGQQSGSTVIGEPFYSNTSITGRTGAEYEFPLSEIGIGDTLTPWLNSATSDYGIKGFSTLVASGGNGGNVFSLHAGQLVGDPSIAFIYHVVLRVWYCDENRIGFGSARPPLAAGQGAGGYVTTRVSMSTPLGGTPVATSGALFVYFRRPFGRRGSVSWVHQLAVTRSSLARSQVEGFEVSSPSADNGFAGGSYSATPMLPAFTQFSSTPTEIDGFPYAHTAPQVLQNTGGPYDFRQYLTPVTTGSYSWLNVVMSKVGNPTGGVTVQIRDPGASDAVLTSVHLAASDIESIQTLPYVAKLGLVDNTWVVGTPIGPVTLTAGHQYAVVFVPDTTSDTDQWAVQIAYPYAGLQQTFGAGAGPGVAGFGGTSDRAKVLASAASTVNADDYLVTLSLAVTALTGFTATKLQQALSVATDCVYEHDFGSIASIDHIDYAHLTWSASTLTLPPAGYFLAYEVQRSDTIDPTWRTVFWTTDITKLSFNDYEGRRNVTSSYRVRQWTTDWTPSAWSSTLTVTPASIQNEYLFVSNEYPSLNCAYFDPTPTGSIPVRGYAFPDSGRAVVRQFYGRDYAVVFHDTEDGGVTFTRTLMVIGAKKPTVPGPTQFDSIRNMAARQQDYVCVLDGDKNRIFAGLIVTDGASQQGREHTVNVQIVQVADTPSTPAVQV